MAHQARGVATAADGALQGVLRGHHHAEDSCHGPAWPGWRQHMTAGWASALHAGLAAAGLASEAAAAGGGPHEWAPALPHSTGVQGWFPSRHHPPEGHYLHVRLLFRLGQQPATLEKGASYMCWPSHAGSCR